MTDRTKKTDAPPKPYAPVPPRPGYDKVIENIEKWANSSGLQKPT